MKKSQLLKQIARMEFIQDQLLTEITTLDEILRLVGFPAGLESVKAAAHELLDHQREEIEGDFSSHEEEI